MLLEFLPGETCPSLTRRVRLFLPLRCFPVFHTTCSFSIAKTVLTSAYPGSYPWRWLFKQSLHQAVCGLDACSRYRPCVRTILMVTPFLLFVLRCFRFILSAR